MKIKKPQIGWLKRFEPDEGMTLRICWAGDGVNQRWDVGWIEITEEPISEFIEDSEDGEENE